MTFSILHTSARPQAWRAVYEAWLKSASDPSQCEYILVCDTRWGFRRGDMVSSPYNPESPGQIRPQDKVIWNTARRCYVDGVNLAAEASTGDVLIVNADDQWPCEGWDERLLDLKQVKDVMTQPGPDFVIEVSTNTPTEHERGIMPMPILSRERYERFGWVFYPEYESMYADNDFCAMARRDGVVIDARHLVFPHKHWINQQRESDAVDAVQNRAEAYTLGERIFKARQAVNVGGIPFIEAAAQQSPQRKVVVACTPGDMFGMAWVNAWTQLALHLAGNYNLYHLMGYTSDAGINRTQMLKNIEECPFSIDYVLWIDDDNTLLPQQFEMLRADLDSHPELDAVAAWCWCGPNEQPANGIPAMVSCGTLKDVELTEDGKDIKYCCGAPLNPKRMKEAASDLIEIGYSGFPAVLMRADLLRKAGKFPFNPFVDDRCLHGKTGEDLAFFARAWARGGAKYAVDRRIEIAHYKRRPTCPTSDPYVDTEIQTEAVNVK